MNEYNDHMSIENTWNSTLSEIFGEISQCHDVMVRRRERVKTQHDAFESYTVSVLDETSQETKLSVETRAALHAVFRKFSYDSGEIAVLNELDCKDSVEALFEMANMKQELESGEIASVEVFERAVLCAAKADKLPFHSNVRSILRDLCIDGDMRLLTSSSVKKNKTQYQQDLLDDVKNLRDRIQEMKKITTKLSWSELYRKHTFHLTADVVCEIGTERPEMLAHLDPKNLSEKDKTYLSKKMPWITNCKTMSLEDLRPGSSVLCLYGNLWYVVKYISTQTLKTQTIKTQTIKTQVLGRVRQDERQASVLTVSSGQERTYDVSTVEGYFDCRSKGLR